METSITAPLTTSDILIMEINKYLIDIEYYANKTTAYLEANSDYFENLRKRDIKVSEKKTTLTSSLKVTRKNSRR
jgi:hypothetical protein